MNEKSDVEFDALSRSVAVPTEEEGQLEAIGEQIRGRLFRVFNRNDSFDERDEFQDAKSNLRMPS